MKLRAEGISRNFFRKGKNTNFFTAVEKTDFELEQGCLTEITGHSGSGKTTFSNMLCGLLTPDSGRVFLGDQSLYELDDRKRSYLRNRYIGIIPQGQTGLHGLTVLENVMLQAEMYGSTPDAREKAVSLLEAAGIGELCEVYSNELSGGELRRMVIARAMMNDPPILIADEPTGDLDSETTALILELFRKYADSGNAVLMVTHEKEALCHADRIFCMEKGILSSVPKK